MPSLGVNRHTGGLENLDALIGCILFVNRHTGGLENLSTGMFEC